MIWSTYFFSRERSLFMKEMSPQINNYSDVISLSFVVVGLYQYNSTIKGCWNFAWFGFSQSIHNIHYCPGQGWQPVQGNKWITCRRKGIILGTRLNGGLTKPQITLNSMEWRLFFCTASPGVVENIHLVSTMEKERNQWTKSPHFENNILTPLDNG